MLQSGGAETQTSCGKTDGIRQLLKAIAVKTFYNFWKKGNYFQKNNLK